MTDHLNIDTTARHIWDCATIDTEQFLTATLGEEIELPETITSKYLLEADDELLDFIHAHAMGVDHSYWRIEYEREASDNVYNSENDFSDVFQFTIFAPVDASEWYWANGVYVAVEVHQGGDVRGNYGAIRLYRVDSPADTGFLDWVIGWYVTDRRGEVDESLTEGASVGYSANPTSALEDNMRTSDVRYCEKLKGFLAIGLDGCPMVVHPDHHLPGC